MYAFSRGLKKGPVDDGEGVPGYKVVLAVLALAFTLLGVLAFLS